METWSNRFEYLTHCFNVFRGGVYDDPKCTGGVDHAVLVVGYGMEDGKKMWIVKNSWGETWGAKGYIHMIRDSDIPHGICSITVGPNYPLV